MTFFSCPPGPLMLKNSQKTRPFGQKTLWATRLHSIVILISVIQTMLQVDYLPEGHSDRSLR